MDPTARDMLKAAKSGDAGRVQELLAADPALLEARDKDGSTPLHCAAWKGHLAVVEVLLAAGAEVAAVNQNEHWGSTPLHAAAHANQAAIASCLIAAGADVNARDAAGQTPLHHTTFHRATAAARVLREQGAV
ncbi:MAG: ankyrin repeat domain-containing protein [Fimbriimonadaceae bacterium]|nr:ankyrin repeat domain-containing protein [Fimbriimonadaceae bacterium]